LLLSPDFEIGAATAVYPNAGPVNSPGSSLNAATLTLAYQANSGIDAFAAPMATVVPGLTVDGLNISPIAIIIAVPVPSIAIATLGHRTDWHQSQYDHKDERNTCHSQFHFSSIDYL
jgi:hypothetical protein